MDNKNVIFNFGLTLKNYDELMEYLDENNRLNDERTIDVLNCFESIMFELAVLEINKLHHVIKEQNDKYVDLLLQVKKAEDVVNEMIKEMAKKAAEQAREKAKKEQEEKELLSKKDQSFIKKLKDRFSNLFNE